MDWDTSDGTRLLNTSSATLWMRKVCRESSFLDFDVCGGYRYSYVAEAGNQGFGRRNLLCFLPRILTCHLLR